MIIIKELNSERLRPIIAFDKLCFPTDYWKEEDWNDLLEDKREPVIFTLLLDSVTDVIFPTEYVIKFYALQS